MLKHLDRRQPHTVRDPALPREWLHGIVPPLSTPFTIEGDLDLDGLDRLVEYVLAGGVHGLFVLGSTGEAAYLEDHARRLVIDRVISANAGQVPIVVGCIAPATRPVIAMAREAAAAGADGVVVAAPFYGRTHPREIEDHYRSVSAAVDLPVIAYDVPASTHVKLGASMIVGLASDATIAGLKDSSGDDASLRLVRMATRDMPISLLTGSELTVDAALLMGLDGAVPGLANVDPEGYVRLWTAGLDGRWDDARREQDRLVELSRILQVGSTERMGRGSAGMSAFKTALHLRGVIDSPSVAPPLRSLDAAETEEVRVILAAADLL